MSGRDGDLDSCSGRHALGSPLSRYRVQSSTLANNLRILAHVYRWARETTEYDLDDHLTRGETLRGREIESLANSLRVNASNPALDTGAFDHQLAVVEDFLKWSVDSENRGGQNALLLEQLAAERGWLQEVFNGGQITRKLVRVKSAPHGCNHMYDYAT